ncbi:calcium-binding protein [Desulfovibrio caledoniensis]
MADTTIQEMQISLPGSGNTEVYQLDGDIPVKFNFDPSNAVFTGENGNLEIAVEGGGTIILENYQDLADAGQLPMFEMPSGEVVAGDAYLFAFNGADQNGDLETAAGNAGSGSGAGQYSDDHGALFDGIDALGGQGDAYDPHAFPTSDPVTGLLLEDAAGPGNEAPTLDLSARTVTFVSEDADNNNMIGLYHLDENGNPTNPEMILLNSNTATPGQVLTTLEDGEELHYFLVVGADHGGANPTFSQNSSGEWVITFEGDPKSYEVRFDDPSINNNFEPTFLITDGPNGRVIAVDDQMRNDQSELGDDDDDFNDTIIQENANAGTGFDNTFHEGLGSVHIAAEVNISDADSTHMSQAVITLTNAQAGDVLAISGILPGTITATVVGNVITLTGDAPISDYESAIELITYNNTATHPNTDPRIIEVQVWDNYTSPTGAASNVATSTIEVIADPVPESASLAAARLAAPADDAVDAHTQVADADSADSAMISTASGETAQATGNLLDIYGGDEANLTAGIVGSAMGSWGALDIASSGEWVYTPYNSDSIGDTSGLDQPTVEAFTYQVTDAHGGTETATLYIPVHVDAAVAADGTPGNDVVYGDNNGSTISGLEGNDFLYGGAGSDHIDGGAGHDYISGGAGNDVLNGGDGNDYLFGGSGDDAIQGGNGNDIIWGGDGNDTIDAGAGNDTVFISSGHDTVTLGAGADTVSIDPTYLTPDGGDGSMTVTDFNVNEGDQLDLSGLTGGVVDVTSSSTSGDLILTIADANHAGNDITITLQGVMASSHADIAHSVDLTATGDELNHLIQHIISTGTDTTT